MRELMAHDFILDCRLVSMLGFALDFLVNVRVLGEHLAHQEFLGESESLNISLSDMHKLSLRVAAQIVVTKERV